MLRVIRTASINVNQAVACLCTKANAKEMGTLLDEAIAKGVATFSLPLNFSARVWMLCPNVVEAMREEF